MKKNILIIILIIIPIIFLFGCNTTIKLGNITGIATLNNTPSSNISVSISGISQITTTDSNGRYTFTGISAGNVVLNFTKSGYSNGITTVTVMGGSDTIVPTVNLSSAYGSITGTARLYGQIDYSDILVEIVGTNTSTTTDSLGKYTFSNLASGSYNLKFSKTGYTSTTVATTVTSGNINTLSVINLSVSTIGNIYGIAQLNGTATSGITVAIQGTSTSTQTASNGSFSFSDLSAGSYTLNYSYSGYFSETQNITVTGGSTSNVTTVSLYPYDVYDLSGILSGTALTMSQALGYLYISTDTHKLYKISESTPDAIPTTSITVTYNCNLIAAGRVRDPSGNFLNIVITLAHSSTPNINLFNIYNDSLNLEEADSETTVNIQAISMLDNTGYAIGYMNSYPIIFKSAIGDDGGPIATYPVTDTGIIGMDYENNRLFACSTDTIYKYSYDGTTLSLLDTMSTSLFNGISDLVGIAYDGTYLWLLDSSNKLYKYIDN